MPPRHHQTEWEYAIPLQTPYPLEDRPSKRRKTSVNEFSEDDHRVKSAAALLGLSVHDLVSTLRNRPTNSAYLVDNSKAVQDSRTSVPLATEEQGSVTLVGFPIQGNGFANASYSGLNSGAVPGQQYSPQIFGRETYNIHSNSRNGIQSCGTASGIERLGSSSNGFDVETDGFHSFPAGNSNTLFEPVGLQELHKTSEWHPQDLSSTDAVGRYICEPFLGGPFTPQYIQEKVSANGYPHSMAMQVSPLPMFSEQDHSSDLIQPLQSSTRPEPDVHFDTENATGNVAAIFSDSETISTMPDTSVTLGGSNSDRSSIPRDYSTPSKSPVLEYDQLPKSTPSHTGASYASRSFGSDDTGRSGSGGKRPRKGKRSIVSDGGSAEANDGSPSPPMKGNKRRKRGPFTSPQERMETGITRKLTACVRCHMQRVRCTSDPINPGGTCLTCINVSGSRLTTLPCLRYKISDMRVYTKGNHPQHRWSRRWKTWKIAEIETWASLEVKTIDLTQDVGSLSLKLQVRKFEPKEGDVLERGWVTNGVQRWHRCATYAIADMGATSVVFMRFVDANIEANIQHYLGDADELLWKTYNTALRHSKAAQVSDARENDLSWLTHVSPNDHEKLLIRRVLRLWVAIRYATRSDRICSEETLGTLPQDYDPDCSNFGHVLVPPLISAQSELIMTVKVLQPLKEKVLRALQELIQKNKTKTWFTTYLAIFILLHSCSMITNYEDRRARKFGLHTRYHTVEFVRELHNGSNIILAYFHYCCKGSHPFQLDWSSSTNIILADLNNEQVEFVKQSAVLIQERKPIFSEIRESGLVEHDFYFISQLYDLDWKPASLI